MKEKNESVSWLTEMLKRYAEENPPDSGDARDVVEKLYWLYMERSRVGNEKVQTYYKTLREKVNLPLREYDEVLYTVSDLCLEYGRMAFIEGLRLGLALARELGE